MPRLLVFVEPELTAELKNALKRTRFNLFVQIYNFGFVSILMYGVTSFVVHVGIISRSLADGMMIGTCVPITVNMVLVLTKSSKGDEASAIFNAAFGNLVGVFLSPTLILLYLGQKGSVDLGTVGRAVDIVVDCVLKTQQ